MSAPLVYLLLRQALQMLSQLARDDVPKDIELLVLRHQLAMLRGQVARPRYASNDRSFGDAGEATSRDRWPPFGGTMTRVQPRRAGPPS